jgi:hypothetical protein
MVVILPSACGSWMTPMLDVSSAATGDVSDKKVQAQRLSLCAA